MLKQYNWENPEIFGVEGTTDYDVRPLVKQFIQHNSWQVPTFETKNIPALRKISVANLQSFSPTNEMIAGGDENKVNYIPFVKINEKKDSVLFQFDGTKYVRIDTLGQSGMTEYNPRVFNTTSVVNSNRVASTSVQTKTEIPQPNQSNTVVKTEVRSEKTRRLEGEEVKQVLQSIIDNSTNSQFAQYAQRLLKHIC